MSNYFLSGERRRSLAAELMQAGCNAEQIKSVADFPPEDADNQLWTHIQIMIEAAEGVDPKYNPKKQRAYLALSTMCFDAIVQEAAARGMDEADFPRSNAEMERYIEVCKNDPKDPDLEGLEVPQLINILKGKVH